MKGCIYRTKDGECDRYAEGGKYHAFCVGDEPCEGRKPSNADRIRAMTDEELADWLEVMISNCESNDVPCRLFCHLAALSCGDCWLAWLKQEVDDG